MSDIINNLPAIALRGTVILPDMIVHFDVSREKSIQAIERAMLQDQKILLITQKDPEVEEPKQEEDEPVNIWREIGSFVGPFVLAFLVAFFLKEYIIINADIPSGSMENTIMTGDRLLGNRLAYLFGEPERGDIIIFK